MLEKIDKKIQNLKTEEEINRAIEKTLSSNHIHKKYILDKLFKKKKDWRVFEESRSHFIDRNLKKIFGDLHSFNGYSSVARDAYWEFTYNNNILTEGLD